MQRTGLSDFTFTFHLHALEEEMATHSSVLAWRIPWTEEPGGLLSMGSHREQFGCQVNFLSVFFLPFPSAYDVLLVGRFWFCGSWTLLSGD